MARRATILLFFYIIDNFIMTKEPSEERHLRRIEKITEMENENYAS